MYIPLKVVGRLLCVLAFDAALFSSPASAESANSSVGSTPKIVLLKGPGQSVVIGPSTGSDVIVVSSTSGFICEDNTCICRGGELSDDCQAMLDNMCDGPLRETPGGWVCDYILGNGVGGQDNGAGQTTDINN